MAIKRTFIEEGNEINDTAVVSNTKTVVSPDIHTPVVDINEEVVNAGDVSTIKQTRVVHEPLVEATHPQEAYDTKKNIFRSWMIIWYILAVIEVILGLRVVFKALGANPFSGFVSLIYSISDILLLPFAGIFSSSVSGSSIIEWSSLIAALIYALIAWGLVNLIHLIRPITPEEVEQIV